MLTVGAACATCPAHRTDLCQAATPPSPAPAFLCHAPQGPSRVAALTGAPAPPGRVCVVGRAPAHQRRVPALPPRSWPHSSVHCGPDSRHIPAGGDRQQRARRPFHPFSRLLAWAALPHGPHTAPCARSGSRSWGQAGSSPQRPRPGALASSEQAAGPAPALALHPSAHGAGGWSGSWAVGRAASPVPALWAPGRQPGASRATRPAAFAGRAWVPRVRPLAPFVRGQHTGARWGLPAARVWLRPRHSGSVTGCSSSCLATRFSHVQKAGAWPPPGAAGGQPCPSHCCAPGHRPLPRSQPVPPEMRTWEGSSGITGERPAVAGRPRTSSGALSPWLRRAPSPPAGHAHTQLPLGPATSRTPADPCRRDQVSVTSQPGTGPDASQGACAPRGWGCAGASVASGVVPQLLWGLRQGLCQLRGALLRRPQNLVALVSSRLASHWRAGDSARLSWALVWRDLQGWLTEQASLRVAFHPKGPCRRVHLQAQVRHRRPPDAQVPRPHAHHATQRWSRVSRQRLGQRVREEPLPWLPAACGGCRHGPRGFPLRLHA